MEHHDESNKYPLTKTEADFRKKELLSALNEYFINYNLVLALRKSTDKHLSDSLKTNDFEGRIKITFDYYPKTNDDIFLNYHGHVQSVTINGTQTEVNHQKRRIFLKKSHLLANARNEVVVLFSSLYGHAGTGVHQFIDPSDKREYLYTQFESFECNTAFPVFDQPDLKATLSIALCGSNDWVLLSNENDTFTADLNTLISKDLNKASEEYASLQKNYPEFLNFNNSELEYLFSSLLDKNYKLSAFSQTEKISCYLYALCAGPYYCYTDSSKYEVPLRIFMRDSLKNCGDPNEFFKITILGMEWYKKFFGYAYPFKKYDQIYCPEYNYGAMENVGLVTYTEVYCWKDTPTNQLRNRFSITVLHELAHMWFGNFVTMKWWDDLWLNESFATFISFLCQHQALKNLNGTIYNNSWSSFNTYKGSAYREDQNSTTHSVYSDILDTEMAHANFDAIVYYKGSSLVKQMFYFIGEQNFSRGLYNYFTKYKWNNTVFDNFVDEMVNAVNSSEAITEADKIRKHFDLKLLSKKWLTESGLNQIELIIETDSMNNTITRFDLKQTPCLDIPAHQNLQTHLMDILFVYKDSDSREIKDVVINPTEITSISYLKGAKTPDAVILNYNDYAYLKWIIDEKSFNFLKTNLDVTKNLDLLSRKLIYRSIYDAVRDAKISGVEYIQTISTQLEHEIDDDLIMTNLQYLSATVSNFIPTKFYQYFTAVLFDLVSKLIKKFVNEKHYILSLLQYLISFATNPEHVKCLQKWIGENEENPSLSIEGDKFEVQKAWLTQDNRFSILAKVFQLRDLALEDKNKLLEYEKTRDKNSDKSIKTELTCHALIPDVNHKKEIWERIIKNQNNESLHNMRALMSGFAPITQLDLVDSILRENFFTDVLTIAKKDYFYIDYFFMFCSPSSLVESSIIERIEKLITELDSSLDYIKRKLQETVDEMKRNLRAQAICEFKMSILNKWDK